MMFTEVKKYEKEEELKNEKPMEAEAVSMDENNNKELEQTEQANHEITQTDQVITLEEFYKKIKKLEESLTSTLGDFGVTQEQILEMVKGKIDKAKYYVKYEKDDDLKVAKGKLFFIDRIKNDVEKLESLLKNEVTHELIKYPFTSKDLDNLYYNVFMPLSIAKDTYYKIEEIENKVKEINLERIEEKIESIKQEVKRLEGETLTELKDEINQKIESKIAELREEINQLKEGLSKDEIPDEDEKDDKLKQLQDEINQLKDEINQLRRTTEEHGKEEQEIELGLFDAYSKRISEIEEEIRSLRENINLGQFKDELMMEVSRIVKKEIERIGVNKDSSNINVEEIKTIVEEIVEKKISELKKNDVVKDNQQQEDEKEEEANVKEVMNSGNNEEVKQESDKKKDIIQTLKENPIQTLKENLIWILVIIAVLVAIGVFLGNRL